MGYFLTGKSRMEQTEQEGYWRLLDNELYMHNTGEISIVPRYFWTDGYSFPSIFTVITGDKHGLDVRPANSHDVCCRFHERIYVRLTIGQLRTMGLLRPYNDMMICDDIPRRYLDIVKVSKKDADDTIKEMMKSVGIDSIKCNMVRFGVRFNLRWWFGTGIKSLNSYNIFHEDIKLVNGV